MFVIEYHQCGWDAESSEFTKLIRKKFKTANDAETYISNVHIHEVEKMECLHGVPEIDKDGNCIEYWYEDDEFKCEYEIIDIDTLEMFGA